MSTATSASESGTTASTSDGGGTGSADSTSATAGSSAGGTTCGEDGCLPTVCSSGQSIAPSTAFDSLAIGTVCRLENGLLADGMTVGLDRLDDEMGTNIMGIGVTACAAFDFGDVWSVTGFTVRAAAVEAGCDHPCDVSCGEAVLMNTFVAEVDGTWSYTGQFDLSDTLTDIAVPYSGMARYVMVCRRGQTPSARDVAVDFVSMDCQ